MTGPVGDELLAAHPMPAPPAHIWVPEGRVGSYLDEVAGIADMIGRPLDLHGRLAVDALTSYGPGGQWLCLETVIKMPRQNGKTAGIETPIALADLFLWGADRIAWTAHLFRTCQEAFEDHDELIAGCPPLAKRVRQVIRANGEEAIILKNGGRIEYLARSKGGGRGLGGKRVVIDEALFFPASAAGALLPILAARPNPQIAYLSSAAKTESDQLRDLTRRGRAGGDDSLAFVEHCAAGSFDRPGCEQGKLCRHEKNGSSPGCVLDNVEVAVGANPAVAAGRVRRTFLVSMRRTLDPTEYAREFFGWDEAAADGRAPITLDVWNMRADPTARPRRHPVGLGLDTSKGLEAASLLVCGRMPNGAPFVEVLRHERGIDWLTAPGENGEPYLRALCDRLQSKVRILGGSSTAQALVPAFDEAHVPYVETASSDFAAATGLVVRDANAPTPDVLPLVHLGDPILDGQIVGARAKTVGDTGSIAWSPERSEGSISAVVAMTLARWQLEVSPQPDYDLAESVG